MTHDHYPTDPAHTGHRRKAAALGETAVDFRVDGDHEQFERCNDLAVQRNARARAAE